MTQRLAAGKCDSAPGLNQVFKTALQFRNQFFWSVFLRTVSQQMFGTAFDVLSVLTSTAINTALCFYDFFLKGLTLRVVTPTASERTAFEKDGCANAGTVKGGKFFD